MYEINCPSCGLLLTYSSEEAGALCACPECKRPVYRSTIPSGAMWITEDRRQKSVVLLTQESLIECGDVSDDELATLQAGQALSEDARNRARVFELSSIQRIEADIQFNWMRISTTSSAEPHLLGFRNKNQQADALRVLERQLGSSWRTQRRRPLIYLMVYAGIGALLLLPTLLVGGVTIAWAFDATEVEKPLERGEGTQVIKLIVYGTAKLLGPVGTIVLVALIVLGIVGVLSYYYFRVPISEIRLIPTDGRK